MVPPRWRPFVQLVVARVREFYREPEVLFWVYGFPLLLAVGLGIAFAGSEPQRFETHMYFPDGVPVAVWHDDVAYDSGDLHHGGPRHRLWMLPDGWQYELTS